MRSLVIKFGQQFGPSFNEIATRWPDIVGERAARGCTPVKLTGRGAKGVLHIRASGAAAVLIEAESARILERITMFCGSPVAGRLKITRAPAKSGAKGLMREPARGGIAPSQRVALQEGLASVKDSRLKAALEKLGGAVYSNSPDKRGPTA